MVCRVRPGISAVRSTLAGRFSDLLLRWKYAGRPGGVAERGEVYLWCTAANATHKEDVVAAADRATHSTVAADPTRATATVPNAGPGERARRTSHGFAKGLGGPLVDEARAIAVDDHGNSTSSASSVARRASIPDRAALPADEPPRD